MLIVQLPLTFSTRTSQLLFASPLSNSFLCSSCFRWAVQVSILCPADSPPSLGRGLWVITKIHCDGSSFPGKRMCALLWCQKLPGTWDYPGTTRPPIQTLYYRKRLVNPYKDYYTLQRFLKCPHTQMFTALELNFHCPIKHLNCAGH